MKVSVTIIALACMGLMFANQSVADLDPATIEGLWLFNDGTGKVAKDADSGPIYIGNDTCCAGRFADAIVDEVIILSVALAEDDVKSLAELGIEGALAVHPTNKLPTTWEA